MVPPGWTPINQTQCGGVGIIESNSYRIATFADTSSPTYTWNFCTDSTCTTPRSALAEGSIVNYSDVSNSTPLQTGTGAPECNCAFNTAPQANGLTPTAANSLVIAQHGAFGVHTLSTPAGFSSVFENSNLPNGPDNRQAFTVQMTPMATGIVSSSYTTNVSNSDNIGCLFSANPGP
jgi:hypothetical protein